MSNFLLNRSLALEAMRVTEAAAIASYKLMGKGQENEADQLAVDAMRKALNSIDIEGTVVIGEGERDKAPMLYIGEQVGTGKGPKVDIALDPLEGTNILASGGNNALSVIAMTKSGGLLHAPDVYMEKIAIGLNIKEQIIDLDNSPKQNLSNIARAKNCDINALVVVILDRPRHVELITKVREAGARIQLIKDGDVAAIIATSMQDSGIDVYMGIGGAPEGVLAAAGLSAISGQMCCRLLFNNSQEKQRASRMGIVDFNKKYYLSDLVYGDTVFAATGVTDGSMLKGVKVIPNNYITTNSIIMHSSNHCIRFIQTKVYLKETYIS